MPFFPTVKTAAKHQTLTIRKFAILASVKLPSGFLLIKNAFTSYEFASEGKHFAPRDLFSKYKTVA
ncbi:unnamed protein product [Dovyalis caffra]|uniref:Uncharacterized protein n=1 Tax=Dovyalis caffra TaxID=77055 RepID=A0AAV1SSR2_9ROSI|nr:unnamed protein product [Dovyalis caffra]